jgi:hypothetical protein
VQVIRNAYGVANYASVDIVIAVDVDASHELNQPAAPCPVCGFVLVDVEADEV